MTNQSEFGDFEESFQKTQKAEAGGGGGDLIPESVYRVVCSRQDVRGDGVLVDHEVIKSKADSKGVKIFLEILDPETVKVGNEAVKTKGQIQEHVFWVTQKNLPYLKRDVATLLGRDLKTLNELTSMQWAGLTAEVGIKHETYNGFKNSRVSFFNAWSPKKGGGDGKKQESKQQAAPPQQPAQSAQAQPAQPAATPDF
jgi:hypothetical protein